MKTKSKVTSIRVEPELYERFKSILESQGKQVSDSVSEFIENHVMINKAVNELMARCDGLIKPISEYKNLGWYRVITYGNIRVTSGNIVTTVKNAYADRWVTITVAQ